jgi:hypothetical protein
MGIDWICMARVMDSCEALAHALLYLIGTTILLKLGNEAIVVARV